MQFVLTGINPDKPHFLSCCSPWTLRQKEKRLTSCSNSAIFVVDCFLRVSLTPHHSGCQFHWLLELSWTCLCLGFLLLNFSSCSFDTFPFICVSCHVCFWSHPLPEHDCPLGNIRKIFVDISLLFYWGDMRLLSLGNSLESCCRCP